MNKSLNVLVYNNSQWENDLVALGMQVRSVNNLKSLVRGLMESEVELIICNDGDITSDKIKKIFNKYSVPFMQVGEISKDSLESSLLFTTGKNLKLDLEKYKSTIEKYSIIRENKDYRYCLDQMKFFDIDVTQVGKDLFIAEVKNYFSKTIKAERSIWIDVPKPKVKLPPILRLKQELKQQKVDQSGLISHLDGCIEEIVFEEGFQIWRHEKGNYVALLWFNIDGEKNQCLLINGLQFSTKNQLKMFFNYLLPTLENRWNLCLTMSEAKEQVYIDGLTGLYNQKFLSESLDKKIEEHKRYKTPFSVLFIDVDHFKQVNDTSGHVVGSGVLKQMGQVLKGLIRNSDYAFRYGGDEFIILLSHTQGDDATLVAERIRSKVEASTFNVNDIDVNVTVSIGLAFYPEHAQSAEEIVRIADEAMYYGKKKSRNIVYKAS